MKRLVPLAAGVLALAAFAGLQNIQTQAQVTPAPLPGTTINPVPAATPIPTITPLPIATPLGTVLPQPGATTATFPAVSH